MVLLRGIEADMRRWWLRAIQRCARAGGGAVGTGPRSAGRSTSIGWAIGWATGEGIPATIIVGSGSGIQKRQPAPLLIVDWPQHPAWPPFGTSNDEVWSQACREFEEHNPGLIL